MATTGRAIKYLEETKASRIIIYVALFASQLFYGAAQSIRNLSQKLVKLDAVGVDCERLDRGREKSSFRLEEAQQREIFFTKMHWALHCYLKASIYWMIYALVRNLLPVDELFKWTNLSSKPGHCYVAGRFVVDIRLSKTFSMNVLVPHLLWRLRQHLRHHMAPQAFIFLYQDQEVIRRKQQEFLTQTEDTYKSPLDLVLRHVMTYPRLHGHRAQMANKRGQLSSPARGARLNCHLRPSRTLAAHKILRRRLVKYALVSTSLFAFLGLIITPLVMVELIRDLGYLKYYAGCDSYLDQLAASGQLSYLSFHLTPHKLYAMVADFLENSFIYLECGMGALLTGALPYIVNSDLQLQWHHTEARLYRLWARVEADNERGNWRHRSTKSDHLPISGDRVVDVIRWSSLKHELSQLEEELSDFFTQFDVADSWTCDILTWSLGIWMLSVTSFRYAFVSSGVTNMPLTVTIGEGIVLAVYTFLGTLLWGMRRRLENAYMKVCSIMAYCQPKDRRRLVRICEKFSQRTCYTFLFGRPFVSLSYLTCIGWTFSCVFVVDSIFRRF